jgi:hypothetical protein
MCRLLLITLALVTSTGSEPAPRPLKPLPIRVDTPLAHISAAREIPDGRVLISNAKGPTVLLLDPVKGTLTAVGAAGGGADRYASPGGLYAGPGGATLLLDRAQTRVFTITSTGELNGSRSIARRGVTSSSDADVDRQRIDAKGLAYFIDLHRPGESLGAKQSTLVRFDADAQSSEVVATLRRAEVRTIPAGDGLTLGRQVIGSPADGWGVAPDGRVAVVRAEPYRVEWHAPDGQVTRGSIVDYTPLPMTEADKKSVASNRRGSVGIGPAGGPATDLSKLPLLFAPTKPPFEPDGVLVSPDSLVWVLRTAHVDATTAIYDVFDGAGRRADRIELPGNTRIVGFGRGVVYARHVDPAGRCELRKYGLR